MKQMRSRKKTERRDDVIWNRMEHFLKAAPGNERFSRKFLDRILTRCNNFTRRFLVLGEGKMAAEARRLSITDYVESAEADVDSVLGSVLQTPSSGGIEDSSDEDDDRRRDDHASAVAPTSPLRVALTEVEQMSGATETEESNHPLDDLSSDHAVALIAGDVASEESDHPTSPVKCTEFSFYVAR